MTRGPVPCPGESSHRRGRHLEWPGRRNHPAIRLRLAQPGTLPPCPVATSTLPSLMATVSGILKAAPGTFEHVQRTTTVEYVTIAVEPPDSTNDLSATFTMWVLLIARHRRQQFAWAPRVAEWKKAHVFIWGRCSALALVTRRRLACVWQQRAQSTPPDQHRERTGAV